MPARPSLARIAVSARIGSLTAGLRRRIIYWYGQLKRLETAAKIASTMEQRAANLRELDRIEAAVDNVPVPLGFADGLYELRQHIELARRRLAAGTAHAAPAAA